MYRVFVISVLVFVLCLGAAIGYSNAQPVHLDYLLGSREIPLIGVIVADFILAVGLTLLICGGRILGMKAETRRLKKQLRDAEAELKTLRDIPLKDV